MILRTLTFLVTLSCFLLSSVLGQPAFAAVSLYGGFRDWDDVFESPLLPASLGRVTEARYCGSRRVVILIQDLHCHPEVQRKISGMLSVFDREYGLSRVFAEGAVGTVDTSWLAGVSDGDLRAGIADALAAEGRLTGAELFSVTAGRPDMLEGLEDVELYTSNVTRLNRLLDRRSGIDAVVKRLAAEIETSKQRHYGEGNRRLERMSARHREGKLDAEKYYGFLLSEAGRHGIETAGYPGLSGYLELLRPHDRIPGRRVSRQLQEYLGLLRRELPYPVYSRLRERTNDFSLLDELYPLLERISGRGAEFDLSRRVPALRRFLDHLAQSRAVNPAQLLREERNLLMELRAELSRSDDEREVVFLVNLFDHLRDFLSNRLTADRYAYLAARLPEFRRLWSKYGDPAGLAAAEPHIGLFDEFYRANIERNGCFAGVLAGGHEGQAQEPGRRHEDHAGRVLRSLRESDDVVAAVTGGFHTAGLVDLLAERNVSCLVVTPNVTQEASSAEKTYEELIRHQLAFEHQTLGALLASEYPGSERGLLLVQKALGVLLAGESRRLSAGDVERLINRDVLFGLNGTDGDWDIRCSVEEGPEAGIFVLRLECREKPGGREIAWEFDCDARVGRVERRDGAAARNAALESAARGRGGMFEELLREYRALTGSLRGSAATDRDALPVRSGEHRESPDTAAGVASHEERNLRLEGRFRESMVSRVTRDPDGRLRVSLERYRLKQGATVFSLLYHYALRKLQESAVRLLGLHRLARATLKRVERIREPSGTLERFLFEPALTDRLNLEPFVTSVNRKRSVDGEPPLSGDAILAELVLLARATDLLIVRNRLTLHEDGPFAHARCGVSRPGDAAIWLGEKLFASARVSDEDIALLLLEEAKHIYDHTLDHEAVAHEDILLRLLKAAAESIRENPGDATCGRDAALYDLLGFPDIGLSRLIGFLRELLKDRRGDGRFYRMMLEEPGSLAEHVREFTGKPERIDTLIHNQGAYRRQAAIELIANGIDAIMAERGEAPVGRFGIGAFQCLAEIERDGDSVSWTTSKDGRTAVRVTVVKKNGDYYFRSRVLRQGVRKGTQVRVSRKRYPDEERRLLEEYVRSKLYLNYRCPLYVNGRLINPLENVSFINGNELNYSSPIPVNILMDEHGYTVEDPGIGMDAEDLLTRLLVPYQGKDIPEENLSGGEIERQVKVFYKPQEDATGYPRVKSSIHLSVSGIIVESFETEGFVLSRDFVIELPASTPLTQDRQHIQLSAQTVKAIGSAVRIVMSRDGEHRTANMNAAAYMLSRLQERDERAGDLLQDMANRVDGWRKELESSSPGAFLFLPNEREFFELEVPGGRQAVYLHPALARFDPARYPGALKVPSWKSSKYALWAVPFIADAVRISFPFTVETGDIILLDREHYELQKSNPAALDLEINPVVTGYEPGGRAAEPRGLLLPDGSGAKDPAESAAGSAGGLISSAFEGLSRVLSGDLLERLFSKVREGMLRTQAGSRAADALELWLKRFASFAGVVPVDANLLRALLRGLSLKKDAPDFTRVKSVQTVGKGLEMRMPTRMARLPDGRLAVVSRFHSRIDILDPESWEPDEPMATDDARGGITVSQDGKIVTCMKEHFQDGFRVIFTDPDTRGQTHTACAGVPSGAFIIAYVILTGHPDPLLNGKLVVCTYEDQQTFMRIYDPYTGLEIGNKFPLKDVGLTDASCMVMTDEGHLAIAGMSGKNALIVLDPSRMQPVRSFSRADVGVETVSSVEAADGYYILCDRLEDNITIIDASTGEAVNRINGGEKGIDGPLSALMVDGKLIVANFDGNSLSEVEFEATDKAAAARREAGAGVRVYHAGLGLDQPLDAERLPDGNLAVLDYGTGTLKIIDTRSWEVVEEREMRSPALAVDRKGRIIGIDRDGEMNWLVVKDVSGADTGRAPLAGLKNGRIRAMSVIEGHPRSELNGMLAFGLSLGGRWFVGAVDPRNPLAFNLESGSFDPQAYGMEAVSDIAVTKQGNLAISGAGSTPLIVVDPDGFRLLAAFANDPPAVPLPVTPQPSPAASIERVSVLNDGSYGICGRDDTLHEDFVMILDHSTGEVLRRFSGPECGFSSPASVVEVRGEIVVCSRAGASLVVLERDRGAPATEHDYARIERVRRIDCRELMGRAYQVAVLDYGSIAVGNMRGAVAVYDAQSGACTAAFDLQAAGAGNVLDMASLPQGRLALFDNGNNTVLVIDAGSGAVLNRITGRFLPFGFTVSPEGEVVTGNDPGGTLFFFDASIRGGELVKKVQVDGSVDRNQNIAVTRDGHIVFADMALVDPLTGQVIKRLDGADLGIKGIIDDVVPMDSGYWAVLSFTPSDAFVSIVDPVTEQRVREISCSGLGLEKPEQIALNGAGDIVLCHPRSGDVNIIEFARVPVREGGRGLPVPDEAGDAALRRFRDAQRVLEDNRMFFAGSARARLQYLTNLFYLPHVLTAVDREKLTPFLAFLPHPLLERLTPGSVEELHALIAPMKLNSLQRFFSLFEEIDSTVLDEERFAGLFKRWYRLFERLERPRMEEARHILFGSLREHRSFLSEFTPAAVADDFLRICLMYLRGDIGHVLDRQERVTIPGSVADEIRDVALARVNAVFGTFPSAVRSVGSLPDYRVLLAATAAYDLSAAEVSVRKSVYGQDTAENLFIRENVQNARNALVIERQAADLLLEYYRRHGGALTPDPRLIEELIPADVTGDARRHLGHRIEVLARCADRLRGAGRDAREAAVELRDELYEAGIIIRNYIPAGTNEWVFSVEDPAGMDLATLIGPLLVIDESTSAGSPVSEGIFGLGFYTNFADCDAVRVTTGNGDGVFSEVLIGREPSGRLVLSHLRQLTGDYKGTRVERIKYFSEDRMPDLDALFVDYNVHRYVAAIQDVRVDYNDRPINEELTLFAEVSTEFGAVRLYGNDSKYRRLTRSLLYVEHPKPEEYFTLVPPQFLKVLGKRGLTIDLPADVPLVRTRLTIAQKEKTMPAVRKALAAACLVTMVKLYLDDGVLPPGLSEDYFADGWNMDGFGVFGWLERDARLINDGRSGEVDFTRYLVRDGDEERIKELKNRFVKYLVTLVRARDRHGREYSLREKKDSLRELLENGIRDAGAIMQRLGLSDASFSLREYVLAAVRIAENADLSDAPRRDYTQEEVQAEKELHDFQLFTRLVLGHLGIRGLKVHFYRQQTRTIASCDENEFSWNLFKVEGYVRGLQEILDGKMTDALELYRFFRKTLDLITHEASHTFDQYKASHESDEDLVGLFAWNQKQLVRRYILARRNWDALLGELKERIGAVVRTAGRRPFQARAPGEYRADRMLVNGSEISPGGIVSVLHQARLAGPRRGVITIKVNGSSRRYRVARDRQHRVYYIDSRLLTGAKSPDEFIALLGGTMALRSKAAEKDISAALPGEVVIAVVDRSGDLFENHRRDHFIGVNRCVIELLSGPEREALLSVGITHELLHEAGFDDEEALTSEDVRLAVSLAAGDRGPRVFQDLRTALELAADGGAFPDEILRITGLRGSPEEERAAREFLTSQEWGAGFLSSCGRLAELFGYLPLRRLFEASGGDAEEMFVHVLPQIYHDTKTFSPSDWPYLLRILTAADSAGVTAYRNGLTVLALAFHDRLRGLLPSFALAAERAGGRTWLLFRYGYLQCKGHLVGRDSVERVTGRLLRLADAAGDMPERLFETRLIAAAGSDDDTAALARDLEHWTHRTGKLGDLLHMIRGSRELELVDLGFTLDGITGLARDILGSRVPAYVNSLDRLLSFWPLNQEPCAPLRELVVNPAVDLRTRLKTAFAYVEIIMLYELISKDTGAGKVARAVRDEIGGLNLLMEGILSDSSDASLQKQLRTKAKRSLKTAREKVLLHLLDDADLVEAGGRLLEDPALSRQVTGIVSLCLTRFGDEEGLAVKLLRGALASYLSEYGGGGGDAERRARRAARVYLSGLDAAGLRLLSGRAPPRERRYAGRSGANREAIEELIAAGYRRELFDDGIELVVPVEEGYTRDKKRERIRLLSDELVRVARRQGIEDAGPVETARQALALKGRVELRGVDPKDDVLGYLRSLSDAVARIEKQKEVPLEGRRFRVTARKDFLREASAGTGVDTCYSPSGDRAQMPFVIASEANSLFILVQDDKGTLAGRAVAILGREGIYLYPEYNNTDYDLDGVFGRAALELARYAPKVFLSPCSAGYQYVAARGAGQVQPGKTVVTKPTVFFLRHWYDHGTVSADGVLAITLEDPLVVSAPGSASSRRPAAETDAASLMGGTMRCSNIDERGRELPVSEEGVRRRAGFQIRVELEAPGRFAGPLSMILSVPLAAMFAPGFPFAAGFILSSLCINLLTFVWGDAAAMRAAQDAAGRAPGADRDDAVVPFMNVESPGDVVEYTNEHGYSVFERGSGLDDVPASPEAGVFRAHEPGTPLSRDRGLWPLMKNPLVAVNPAGLLSGKTVLEVIGVRPPVRPVFNDANRAVSDRALYHVAMPRDAPDVSSGIADLRRQGLRGVGITLCSDAADRAGTRELGRVLVSLPWRDEPEPVLLRGRADGAGYFVYLEAAGHGYQTSPPGLNVLDAGDRREVFLAAAAGEALSEIRGSGYIRKIIAEETGTEPGRWRTGAVMLWGGGVAASFIPGDRDSGTRDDGLGEIPLIYRERSAMTIARRTAPEGKTGPGERPSHARWTDAAGIAARADAVVDDTMDGETMTRTYLAAAAAKNAESLARAQGLMLRMGDLRHLRPAPRRDLGIGKITCLRREAERAAKMDVHALLISPFDREYPLALDPAIIDPFDTPEARVHADFPVVPGREYVDLREQREREDPVWESLYGALGAEGGREAAALREFSAENGPWLDRYLEEAAALRPGLDALQGVGVETYRQRHGISQLAGQLAYAHSLGLAVHAEIVADRDLDEALLLKAVGRWARFTTDGAARGFKGIRLDLSGCTEASGAHIAAFLEAVDGEVFRASRDLEVSVVLPSCLSGPEAALAGDTCRSLRFLRVTKRLVHIDEPVNDEGILLDLYLPSGGMLIRDERELRNILHAFRRAAGRTRAVSIPDRILHGGFSGDDERHRNPLEGQSSIVLSEAAEIMRMLGIYRPETPEGLFELGRRTALSFEDVDTPVLGDGGWEAWGRERVISLPDGTKVTGSGFHAVPALCRAIDSAPDAERRWAGHLASDAFTSALFAGALDVAGAVGAGNPAGDAAAAYISRLGRIAGARPDRRIACVRQLAGFLEGLTGRMLEREYLRGSPAFEREYDRSSVMALLVMADEEASRLVRDPVGIVNDAGSIRATADVLLRLNRFGELESLMDTLAGHPGDEGADAVFAFAETIGAFARSLPGGRLKMHRAFFERMAASAEKRLSLHAPGEGDGPAVHIRYYAATRTVADIRQSLGQDTREIHSRLRETLNHLARHYSNHPAADEARLILSLPGAEPLSETLPPGVLTGGIAMSRGTPPENPGALAAYLAALKKAAASETTSAVATQIERARLTMRPLLNRIRRGDVRPGISDLAGLLALFDDAPRSLPASVDRKQVRESLIDTLEISGILAAG